MKFVVLYLCLFAGFAVCNFPSDYDEGMMGFSNSPFNSGNEMYFNRAEEMGMPTMADEGAMPFNAQPMPGDMSIFNQGGMPNHDNIKFMNGLPNFSDPAMALARQHEEYVNAHNDNMMADHIPVQPTAEEMMQFFNTQHRPDGPMGGAMADHMAVPPKTDEEMLRFLNTQHRPDEMINGAMADRMALPPTTDEEMMRFLNSQHSPNGVMGGVLPDHMSVPPTTDEEMIQFLNAQHRPDEVMGDVMADNMALPLRTHEEMLRFPNAPMHGPDGMRNINDGYGMPPSQMSDGDVLHFLNRYPVIPGQVPPVHNGLNTNLNDDVIERHIADEMAASMPNGNNINFLNAQAGPNPVDINNLGEPFGPGDDGNNLLSRHTYSTHSEQSSAFQNGLPFRDNIDMNYNFDMSHGNQFRMGENGADMANQGYLNDERVRQNTPLASSGIHFSNIDDDDDLFEDRGFPNDTDMPIFPFKPGDFAYPNNDDTNTTTSSPITSTSSTTNSTSTTIASTTPATTTITIEEDSTTTTETPTDAVFIFAPEDFDTIPSIPTTGSNVPELPSRRKPENTTGTGDDDDNDDDDDDDDDSSSVVTEPIDTGPEWDDSHPCRYKFLTHNVEISRTGRRVSDIQCEYNMWQYKYKVLEAERKSVECDRILRELNESKTAVIGGRRASQGEFPHMGAVGWRRQDNDYSFMCGSSLISTRFAITAAHCSAITDYKRIEKSLVQTRPELVRFGSVFIKTENDTNRRLQFVDVPIDGPLLRLKKYTFAMKYNDVALIRLKEEVVIQANVRPACLWNGYLRGVSAANITGWGQTVEEKTSDHLLFAEIDFIERDTCRSTLEGRAAKRVWRGLVGYQFCAGKMTGGVDTCEGDSGGPIQLQYPLPSNIDNGVMYHVVGVTSFGIKCARPNSPGIYTNVSDHNILCWIEKTVWPDEPNQFCDDKLFEGYEPPPRN